MTKPLASAYRRELLHRLIAEVRTPGGFSCTRCGHAIVFRRDAEGAEVNAW